MDENHHSPTLLLRYDDTRSVNQPPPHEMTIDYAKYNQERNVTRQWGAWNTNAEPSRKTDWFHS